LAIIRPKVANEDIEKVTKISIEEQEELLKLKTDVPPRCMETDEMSMAKFINEKLKRMFKMGYTDGRNDAAITILKNMLKGGMSREEIAKQ